MFDNVHYSIIIATIVIFICMIFVLNSIFYKPLLKFMDERNESIENDEKKVKENSDNILQVDDELKKIHDLTREEVLKIKNEAMLLAKNEKEKSIKNKKEELESKLNSFYDDLSKQRAEFEQELSSHLSDLRECMNNKFRRI